MRLSRTATGAVTDNCRGVDLSHNRIYLNGTQGIYVLAQAITKFITGLQIKDNRIRQRQHRRCHPHRLGVPRSRRRCMSRRTHERQQPNSSATSAVGIPASRAAATRSRKSIEYAAIAQPTCRAGER